MDQLSLKLKSIDSVVYLMREVYNGKTKKWERQEKKFLWENLSEGKDKVTFSKDIAESVIGTFELIIKTLEGTNKTSITVDQLKALREECRKLYYNKKVILQ